MPKTTTSSITSTVVGHAIREARVAAGVTQMELARRLGSSAPYVSALENGRANSTIGHLSAVATALQLELHVEFRKPEAMPEPVIPAPPEQFVSR